jgi:TolB protein
MNADGSDVVQLTTDPVMDPIWSPDRRRIAFGGVDASPGIFVMNADGSGAVRLARSLDQPECRPFIDTGGCEGTNGPIWDSHPAWSPDGKRIAYSGVGGIWIMNADGSQLDRVTESPVDDLDPAWSPDGTRIAFVRGSGPGGDLYLMNADGSGVRKIYQEDGRAREPAWSPDGDRIVFREGDEIHVVKADGSDHSRLTSDSEPALPPTWSRDGGGIGFLRCDDDGHLRIYSMADDGSHEAPISEPVDWLSLWCHFPEFP